MDLPFHLVHNRKATHKLRGVVSSIAFLALLGSACIYNQSLPDARVLSRQVRREIRTKDGDYIYEEYYIFTLIQLLFIVTIIYPKVSKHFRRIRLVTIRLCPHKDSPKVAFSSTHIFMLTLDIRLDITLDINCN